MKERLAAVAALGALGVGAASTRLISQLSISAAVILGSASLYVVQRFLTLDTVVNEEPIETMLEDGSTDFEDVLPDYGVVYNEDTGMLEPVDHDQLDSEEQTKQLFDQVTKKRKMEGGDMQKSGKWKISSLFLLCSSVCLVFRSSIVFWHNFWYYFWS